MNVLEKKLKLPIVLGMSAIIFISGYLNQLNTGFNCLTELGIIFIGNMLFWLGVFPFIYRQESTDRSVRFFKTNLINSIIIILVNQVFTFFLLLISFKVIFNHQLPYDIISHVMTNHLLINWFGYWIILAACLYGHQRQEKDQKKMGPLVHLLVKQNGFSHKVDVSEIIWIAADKNCVWIKTPKNKYVVYDTLKNMGDFLPDNFVRIHRSMILNINHANSFATLKSGDVDVTLDSGDTVRMSRNYKSILQESVPQVA